jgi:NAD(P)H-hydrate epimerase
MADSTDPLPKLPVRDPRGHKGTFGSVAVVGGCAQRPSDDDPGATQMVGGPCFAALAALRSGAGLARLVVPAPLMSAGLSIAPSATGVALSVDERGAVVPHLGARALDEVLLDAQCVAIGPGLGAGDGPRALALRAVAQTEAPIVLDADALNALAETPEFHRDFRAPAVLTPHVGEFRRLAATLGATIDPLSQPQAAAEDLARRIGAVIVLKSAATVVTDGHRTWTHDNPNSALATAGSGDVLTGVIAGLVAQHHRRPLGAGSAMISSERQGGLSLYDCARLGVRAHALAADAWVKRSHATGGLLAGDLLEELPGALESLRR